MGVVHFDRLRCVGSDLLSYTGRGLFVQEPRQEPRAKKDCAGPTGSGWAEQSPAQDDAQTHAQQTEDHTAKEGEAGEADLSGL